MVDKFVKYDIFNVKWVHLYILKIIWNMNVHKLDHDLKTMDDIPLL